MSIKAIRAVFEWRDGTPTERLVMLALADRCNDAWKCWPSVGDVCERTRLSETTVHRTLSGLADGGPLAVERFGGVKGRHGGSPTHAYTIVPERMPQGVTRTPSDVPRVSPCASQGVTGAPEPSGEPSRPKPSAIGAEFAVFYDRYPKKVARADALKAYRAARKVADAATILAGLETSPQLKRERQYIPAAGPWLRGEGWADEPAPVEPGDSEPVTTWGDAPC